MSSLTSTAVPAPAFLRIDSMQCIAQSVPAVMANVPQAPPTTLPHAATALNGAATNSTAAAAAAATPSVLSPLAPLGLLPAQLLAYETEQRLKSLISTALQFMRHSRRTVLSTDDINRALRHKNEAPLYGFDNASAALSGDSTLHFTQPADDVFLLTDTVMNFEDLLQQPLPKVPVDPTFSLHWLAVDGVQPLIPQNPLPIEVMPGGLANATAATAASASTVTATVTLDKSDKEVVARAPVKHVLSKEQQLYYEYVTSALRGTDSTLKKAVYKSLSEDDGLYQLLPYFTQFIAEEVSHNLHNRTLLLALMRMANCLLYSKYLHVEPYLHQLLPSILTCIVGKQLCLEPFEDHWALRDYTAELLNKVCTEHGHKYPSLQPRVTRTLLQAWLDPSRSLNTHYGCIQALSQLGHTVVKALILPYIKSYFEVLTPAMNSSNEATRIEASYVYQALLQCVGVYVQTEMSLATNPAEFAAAVAAATNAAQPVTSSAAAAGAASASPSPPPIAAMEDTQVSVKKEGESAAASKKRRRVEGAATAASSSAAASSAHAAAPASVALSAAALLPDSSTLAGIQLLQELFGESLQPYLTSALVQHGQLVEQQQQQQGKSAAAASKTARNMQFSIASVAL